MPAEGRRRCDGDTEGAAQQLLRGSAPGGFSGPPGDGSHAFIQSPRSCDSGRSAGRHSSAAEVVPSTVAATAPSVAAGSSRRVTGAVPGASTEPLIQCRGGMALTSPGLPPPRSSIAAAVSCQPGARAVSFGVPLSAFLNLRTGELVHPVRAKHCLPGDRHGPWNSFRSMPSDAASTGLSSAAPGAPGEPSTGVGGGRRTAGLPCFCAPNGDSVSELTWLSGDL